jgi:RND family efflux transporter MFP subunit
MKLSPQFIRSIPVRFRWGAASVLLLAIVSPLCFHALHGSEKADPPSNKAVSAAVAKVQREDLSEELACEADLRPYQEIDLHAKVAGYLQSIAVDIGDQVEAGRLLATIEIPELQDDINGAVAAQKRSQQEVARTEAAYEEAHVAFNRLSAVNTAQPNLVAEQELDVARARDRTTASALAAAKAQVEVAGAEMDKLQTMHKYCRITAPFSGVITKRYADPGALIQAGTSSSTQTLPLVRLSQNDRLRLDIPVSVSYVSKIKLGQPVEIRVDSAGQVFTGNIARTNRKVDTATRSMEVEVDVPNSDLKLIPGMYASVLLRLDHREKTLTVPIQAVSRQQSCSVFVVDNQNRIEERTIRIGLETPQKLEVLAGVSENDLVLLGSRARFKPGELVEPKLVEETKIPE